VRVLRAVTMPGIYESVRHIDEVRASLLRQVTSLTNDPSMHFERPPALDRATRYKHCDVMPLVFLLCYHGLPVTTYVAAVSKMYRAATPSLNYTATGLAAAPRSGGGVAYRWQDRRTGGRVKVGFVTKFMDNHPAGRAWGGILVNLPRDKLEITAVCLNKDPEEADKQYQYIKQGVERYLDLRNHDWFEMREAIAAEQFDVLIYLEVGMDALTYFLAHTRLAPVQCVTWGHSMSSGIPALDYFITLDNELPEAHTHYTETPLFFKSSSVFFLPPREVSATPTRAEFGLSPEAHIYLCPQSMHKMHPDFDHMMAAVLKRDPLGVVVLIDKPGHKHLTPILRERLHRTIPEMASRIIILPTAPDHGRFNMRRHFLELIQSADVMIDSYPIGGGTTSIEAFATNIPIVTLPGKTLPGRFTEFMLRYMDIPELVAKSVDEYVEIAFKVASDSAWQAELRGRIQANKGRLYRDQSAVDEWADFLEHVPHGNIGKWVRP